MKVRDWDPRKLDVEAFAKAGAVLSDHWPMQGFERLVESGDPDSPPAVDAAVAWQARGELRPVRGGAAQVWLHLEAGAALDVQCQRCLRAVPYRVEARRSFRFVHGEQTAAELDADSEDDVLALTRSLDLHELLEDELLLSLPLAPRHDACPVSLPASAGSPEAAASDQDNPFAALAALRRPGGRR